MSTGVNSHQPLFLLPLLWSVYAVL